ncbi:MAG: ABC-2 family transporter protein [Verrucomicrobiae bacterium]|nr:ABC-2 family transporter protein [Verrucomicrobiae bacterium]
MRRYLRLAFALFRYSLAREMMFKANFLLWIVVEIAWLGLQLALVEVIFAHVTEVAGWTKYEMVMLVGTSHLVQQIFQVAFLVNLIEFPENVRTGKLDFALLQPASPQFLVSIRKYDPGSVVNCAIGVAFVAWAAWKLGLRPAPWQLGLYALMVLNGVFLHYALMLMIVTLAFWIVRAQGLVYGYYNLFNIARMPREAFRGAAKVLFTWVLPMLVVANFPAQVLARGVIGSGATWIFLLTLAFLALARVWFRFGLRFYTSASS